MTITREVLNISVGNYSNFVAAHYWNIQHQNLERNLSVKDDCSVRCEKIFRELRSERSEVAHGNNTSQWKPRTILVDLEGSLGGMSECGTFISSEESKRNTEVAQNSELLSDEQCDIYQQETIAVRSDDGAQRQHYWTDMIKFELDSQSLCVVDSYYHNREDYAFTNYCLGVDVWKSLRFASSFEDKLHYWVEECDNIEGFQLFCDIHDGFSGVTTSLLSDLHDDFSNKSIVAHGNWPTSFLQSHHAPLVLRASHAVNMAMSMQALMENSDLFEIQSLMQGLFTRHPSYRRLPNLVYQNESSYETSAILASAIDNVSHPWMLKDRAASMSEVCRAISLNKWKLTSTSIAIPHHDSVLLDTLLANNGFHSGLLTSLAPFHTTTATNPTSPFASLLVASALSHEGLRPRSIDRALLRQLNLHHDPFTGTCQSILWAMYEQFHPRAADSCVCVCADGVARLVDTLTVPRRCDVGGDEKHDTVTVADERTPTGGFVEGFSGSVLTGQTASKDSFDLLLGVWKEVERLDLSRLHAIVETGLDEDSLLELKEFLLDTMRLYDEQRFSKEIDEQ